MEEKTTLDVQNLNIYFKTADGEQLHAVRDLTFQVKRGELLGIVGESGCGKSVSSLAIMGLLEFPGVATSDHISLLGKDISKYSREEMRKLRGSELAMIFQEPMTSLNPLFTVGAQISDTIELHQKCNKQEAKERAIAMLKKVGIPRPEAVYKEYPNELSGGMRQRVMIAIALVGSPSIVIADEPTTSLDVTIEAQILDVLKNLQKTLGTSIILITHDLGVIAKLCDRVLVMYGGKIVERGSVDEIFYDTAHPYTKGLMHSIAKLDTAKGHKLQPIEGTPPDLFAPPKGCPFAARCEYCMEICKDMPPQTYELSKEHETCCWLQHEYAPDTDMRRKVTEKGEV